MFTKQDTDDGPTPRCCLADRVTPAGAAPMRTCGVRAVDMEALCRPVLSVLLDCACLRLLYWPRGGLFFIYSQASQKTVSDQFFVTTFSFFLVYFWQQPGWEPGVRVCVGPAATPVQGQSCLLSNFIHHVLVCTAQQ